MMDKKPTREEAMEAGRKVWCSGPAIPEDIVDAVAAPFGGFAPSVVEVPVLGLVAPAGSKVWTLGTILNSAGSIIGTELHRPILSAVAARSNAWEEVKERVDSILRCWKRSSSKIDLECGIEALQSRLSDPEMGVGPKGKA